MCNKINTNELKELLNTETLDLIDIRNNYSYLSGTIENAKNISSNSLIANPSKYLEKNKKYYIFCNNGSSSEFVCNYLYKLGYNVINIVGGYNSYIKGSNK